MHCEVHEDHSYGNATVVNYLGEPWILARDICTELNYHNVYAMLTRYVSKGNKIHLQIPELKKKTGAGRPPTLFVNQKGLEEIIRRANQNPKAMAIHNWLLQNKQRTETKKPVPAAQQRQLVEIDERYGKALRSIFESVCAIHGENQDLKRELREVHSENRELKQELSSIRTDLGEFFSSMRINGTNWKDAAKIIAKSGSRNEIQNRFHDLYHLLEQASHVNLKVRRDNLQKKHPTKKISILDAIEEDSKLVELFVVILRKYALTHGVNVEIDENWKGAA